MTTPINRVVTIRDESFEAIHVMYSNAKYVALVAILILFLCVLNTEQTLFSRWKNTTPVPTDNEAQQSVIVPHKETSHWWQFKFKPEQNEQSGSNQVTVSVPLVQQKFQSAESHINTDVKWVPCLCPIRKGEYQHHKPQPQKQHQNQHQQQQPPPQQQQHQHQHQQQQQQQQQQQPQQQYGSSYYPPITTPAPSEIVNDVPRFIIANYPIEA